MSFSDFEAGHIPNAVAGPYSGIWDGLNIGNITEDGYRLVYNTDAITITSDGTGSATTLDKIMSGISMQIQFTLENWNAPALEKLIWWFGADSNVADGDSSELGVVKGVGMRHFDHAQALVLNACHQNQAGDAADPINPTIDPLEITFPKALLANGSNIEILLASKPRFIPVTMDIFPVAANTEVVAAPTDAEAYDSAKPPSNCAGFRFFFATRNPNYSTT